MTSNKFRKQIQRKNFNTAKFLSERIELHKTYSGPPLTDEFLKAAKNEGREFDLEIIRNHCKPNQKPNQIL